MSLLLSQVTDIPCELLLRIFQHCGLRSIMSMVNKRWAKIVLDNMHNIQRIYLVNQYEDVEMNPGTVEGLACIIEQPKDWRVPGSFSKVPESFTRVKGLVSITCINVAINPSILENILEKVYKDRPIDIIFRDCTVYVDQLPPISADRIGNIEIYLLRSDYHHLFLFRTRRLLVWMEGCGMLHHIRVLEVNFEKNKSKWHPEYLSSFVPSMPNLEKLSFWGNKDLDDSQTQERYTAPIFGQWEKKGGLPSSLVELNLKHGIIGGFCPDKLKVKDAFQKLRVSSNLKKVSLDAISELVDPEDRANTWRFVLVNEVLKLNPKPVVS